MVINTKCKVNYHHPSIYFIVHCVWNDWIQGKCSKSCGTGTRDKTRTEKILEAHGGRPCEGVASDVENCNVQECPGCKKNLFQLHFLYASTQINLHNHGKISLICLNTLNLRCS